MPTIKKKILNKEKTPVDTFEDLGFQPLDKPSEEKMPRMPINITAQNNISLGSLMSRYAAWREYAEDLHERELAKFVMLEEEYQNDYDQQMVIAEGRTLADKKVTVRVIPSLVVKRKKLLEQETLVSLLSSRVESLNNSIATISREITRRGQNNEPRDGSKPYRNA